MNNWLNTSYLSLATRKKDGSRVNTPVWFACNDHTFYCFSEAKAGKVKRLRNFSDVNICPCTVTGKLIGDWQTGEGTLLDAAEAKTAYRTLLKKYGWQMRILDTLSWLSRKRKNRVFIKITLPR